MRVVDPSHGSVLRSHRRAMSCQFSSTQVVDPSHGSVLRSHRRAMSCQISSIFSTRLVDPSRTSVVRLHSKVMHDPCRPPRQVSAYAPPRVSKHPVSPSPDRSPSRLHHSTPPTTLTASRLHHAPTTRFLRALRSEPGGDHQHHVKQPEYPAQENTGTGPSPDPETRRSTL